MEENPLNASPNTSSLPPEVTTNLHTATGVDRALTLLYKKIGELDQEVHDLKTQKILDETKLPPELLEQNGMFPPDPKPLRRGRGFRPLLRSEIEDAIKVSLCGNMHYLLDYGSRSPIIKAVRNRGDRIKESILYLKF